MEDLLSYLGIGGGIATFIFVFTSVIKKCFKITPVEIHPVKWLGNLFWKPILDEIAPIRDGLRGLKEDFDEHVAQSYRSKILNFQDKLLSRGVSGHTKEEWDEVVDACDRYEDFVKRNNVQNGKCERAIAYIKRNYDKVLDANDFDHSV